MSDLNVLEQYQPLFEPRSVAVVGASETASNAANKFIDALVRYEFPGAIYPIHPRAAKICGVKAYSSIEEVPETIDFAFVAVKAPQVVSFIANARNKVRVAQIMSSGFGETKDGALLEHELVVAARNAGVRLVGPNCMGIQSPRGKLAMIEGAMASGGEIGFLSQSGGLCLDVLRRGKEIGLKFSAAVSMGNCADIGPNDLLEYMIADPGTKCIGMYLENVRDGRRFFEQLRALNAAKPIVILKGGRTQQGQRAAASHTGSLVEDARLWNALALQTGVILVDDINEMINCLVAFQCQRTDDKYTCNQVVLFGNGGGTSVVATDQFSDCGLSVKPFERQLLDELESLGLSDGASVGNPIDIPGNILMRDGGETACRVIEHVRTQKIAAVMVVHLNLTVLEAYDRKDTISNLVHGIVSARGIGKISAPLHLVLRSNGAAAVENLKSEVRRLAMAAQVPVFDELKDSARVLSALHRLENYRIKRESAAATVKEKS